MGDPSTFTRAPTIGVPVESDTVPLMVPVLCANIAECETRRPVTQAAASHRRDRLITNMRTSGWVGGDCFGLGTRTPSLTLPATISTRTQQYLENFFWRDVFDNCLFLSICSHTSGWRWPLAISTIDAGDFHPTGGRRGTAWNRTDGLVRTRHFREHSLRPAR